MIETFSIVSYPTIIMQDGPKDFGVTGLAFCPADGQKLAVAQTDGIVYVYRLGGERKSICNKFLSGGWTGAAVEEEKTEGDGSGVGAPVTCLAWPASHVRMTCTPCVGSPTPKSLS